MFISKAYAADFEVAGEESFVPLTGEAQSPAGSVDPPSTAEAFIWNIGMVLVLVALFYVLLIAPQQKRFKQHSAMLAGLKKGDRVVTGGGLVGKIEKLVDEHEVLVDLGGGVKVTALRSTIHGKDDPLLRKKSANDSKSDKKGKTDHQEKDTKKK